MVLVLAATYILVVHPSGQARSSQELIAVAKAKPGALSFGSETNHGTREFIRTSGISAGRD